MISKEWPHSPTTFKSHLVENGLEKRRRQEEMGYWLNLGYKDIVFDSWAEAKCFICVWEWLV